jgi:hypothetical protein
MPWLFGNSPMVFPIYLGLPWGLALGPLPNIPLPVPIHTRFVHRLYLSVMVRVLANDHGLLDACYEKVCVQMQLELDRLFTGQSGTPSKIVTNQILAKEKQSVCKETTHRTIARCLKRACYDHESHYLISVQVGEQQYQ